MLKFENLANVGDVIRGYDFMGMKDAYIQGTVTAKGSIYHPVEGFYMYEAYTIMVDKDGAGFGREGDTAYIPFETSMEYDGRVELIQDDNQAEYDLAEGLMRYVRDQEPETV